MSRGKGLNYNKNLENFTNYLRIYLPPCENIRNMLHYL